MKRSDELRQERSGVLDKMTALNSLAKDRSFTEEEQRQWNDLENLEKELLSRVNREERAEEIAAEKAASEAKRQEIQRKKDKEGTSGEEVDKRKIVNNYRFTKALRSLLPHGKLEGLEKEMHEEAESEARTNSVALTGVGAPSFLIDMRRANKRNLVVGTDADGGYTVPDQMRDFIGPLTPKVRVLELGATLLTGLQGNIPIPRQTAIASATWEGEVDANAETTPTFDQPSMSPKRLGAFTEYSKQLLVQSSIGIEQLVRNDLARAIGLGLDSAAINGSGTAPVPEGILNVTGIGSVAMGTNGGAPDRDALVKLINEIKTDDADIGEMAFLTTPGIEAKLMTTKVDAGSGQFVWPMAGQGLLGYRTATSTQVPSDLTKGTGTNLHAIIFGVWSQLMIGQWAGVDLVLDPYTKAKNASVNIVVNSWYDLLVRHVESFAAIKDADATIA